MLAYARAEFRVASGLSTCDLSSDAPYESAEVVHRITASALAGWIEYRKSFFYVRAYSRRFTTLYELEPKGESVRLRPLLLPDLLMHYLFERGARFPDRRAPPCRSRTRSDRTPAYHPRGA